MLILLVSIFSVFLFRRIQRVSVACCYRHRFRSATAEVQKVIVSRLLPVA